jgi:hypothetical protein
MDPERFGKQNPRHIKPEQLEAFSSIIMEIIGREVESPQERQRIYDKIAELQKSSERLLLTFRDTPPRRRSRRRASELTPAATDLLAEIDRAVFGADSENRRGLSQICGVFGAKWDGHHPLGDGPLSPRRF